MRKYCDDMDSKAMFDELPDPKPKKKKLNEHKTHR